MNIFMNNTTNIHSIYRDPPLLSNITIKKTHISVLITGTNAGACHTDTIVTVTAVKSSDVEQCH